MGCGQSKSQNSKKSIASAKLNPSSSSTTATNQKSTAATKATNSPSSSSGSSSSSSSNKRRVKVKPLAAPLAADPKSRDSVEKLKSLHSKSESSGTSSTEATVMSSSSPTSKCSPASLDMNGDVRQGEAALSTRAIGERVAGRSAFKDKMGSAQPAPSPLPHVTNSQIDFFRMLDKKIDEGDDYSSDRDNT